MARCELLERDLIIWRYQSYHNLHNDSQSPRNLDYFVPSRSTLSPNDLQFYLPEHPNTQEYNKWLAIKHYVTTGPLCRNLFSYFFSFSIVDGGSLHDFMKFLEKGMLSSGGGKRQQNDSQPTSRSSGISRNMNHSLLNHSLLSTTSSGSISPMKKVSLHPSISYEISRFLSQHNAESTKKRKWEDERDALIHQIENKVLVCIDINKLSYQQNIPEILLLEGGSSRGSSATPLCSKICCAKRITISHERHIFPTYKWSNFNVYERLKSRYEMILDDEAKESAMDEVVSSTLQQVPPSHAPANVQEVTTNHPKSPSKRKNIPEEGMKDLQIIAENKEGLASPGNKSKKQKST